jgi:cysteine desulfurase/selenocysteine lyase
LDELKKIFEEKEVSYLNIITLGKCVDLIKNIGLENIKNYLLNLTQLFINDLRFEDEEKIEFLPGVFYAKCATGYGIISFKFKKIKNSEVLPIFEKNKIYLRLSNHCYHKSENKFDQIIRVSIHINNRLDEIKKTTQLIKKILKHSP